MTLPDRALTLVATGFGSGRAPFAPGTFGTIAALACIAIIDRATALHTASWRFAILAATLSAIGVWASARTERLTGQHDAPCIVIDEWAGLAWTLTGHPLTGLNAALGFMFFRVLDIVKPFPIRSLQRLPHGWGIMADDVAAGLVANALLFGVERIFAR